MSDLQITVAFVIIAVAVVAAGLFSWGISGMFSDGTRKATPDAESDEDFAAKLTRKNLEAKRAHTDG